MPLVSGVEKGSVENTIPGRIHNTRKLLLSAAVIMSVMLLLSSFVAAALIPESAYQVGGAADGRAIAYLAHLYLGNIFGTIYDISTILILWFAGASAMAGLLNLIPRYLPRYGMAPDWVAYQRPLVLVLLAIDVLITLVFRASVTAQGGAYATGVLVLMLSAAVAVTVSLWHEASLKEPRLYLLCFYFFLVAARIPLHHHRQHHRAARRRDHRQHLHLPAADGQRAEPHYAVHRNARFGSQLHR